MNYDTEDLTYYRMVMSDIQALRTAFKLRQRRIHCVKFVLKMA